MRRISKPILDRRRQIAAKFLVGSGVEIGALHYPIQTSTRAKVRYVDRMNVDGLRKHYPELDQYKLVNVDIVDDGETLATIADDSLDFIIANHMLEHTENPLGTIRNHLKKIRRGGTLYYAVPDKRCGFDINRPLTPFEHLLRDDRDGAHSSRTLHFQEWVRFIEKVEDPAQAEIRAQVLMDMNYSIHFHIWDCDHFRDFLKRARAYLGHSFKIKYFGKNYVEAIAVLKKPRRPPILKLRWGA